MSIEPQIRYARTSDGVSIAYSLAGSGPLLIWAPDLPHCHVALDWEGVFRPYLEQLATEFTLVRFDARGLGLSDRDVADFSFDARSLDLEAVVEDVGQSRFALMGQEWSGPLAITYAARHPESVTHLILMDTFSRAREYMEHPLTKISMELLDRDWELFVESRVALSRGAGDDGIQTREWVDFYEACITQETDRLLRPQLAEDDVTGLLSTVDVPTLIIHHTGTRTRPIEMARGLAAGIRGSQLVTLDGGVVGRWPRVVSQIAGFVKNDQTPSPSRVAVGTRTVLFTDIVGHTEMMQRLGDAKGRDVLREHERITRETLKTHAGAEVKAMGDGFMAWFPSAAAAVGCAVDLQKSFSAWNDERGGGESPAILVRVGINAGEPIEEDGDLFGMSVIAASRICAQAGGGEIVVSDVVRQLVAGKGFLFGDRGVAALKGFEDPVPLYDVRWQE